MQAAGRGSISVYLDDEAEPLATYRPPATLHLDTTKIEDGEHRLRLNAVDALGTLGTRIVRFTVRNGPGITVTGLRDGTTVHGVLDIEINSFGGDEPFDPERAESHGPIPVWTWVMIGIVAAWALWYGLEFFSVPAQFAATPTYASNPALAAASEPAARERSQKAPVYSGKGAAGGFDYEASGASGYAANCAACHGAAGAGVPGAFPALARDPVVDSKDPKEQITIVLHGLHGETIAGQRFGSVMPSFSQLSDQVLAAIIDHERSSWGNHSPTITPDDVKRAR